MSTETILSFYEVGKNILLESSGSEDLITFEQLYLAGTGQTICGRWRKPARGGFPRLQVLRHGS